MWLQVLLIGYSECSPTERQCLEHAGACPSHIQSSQLVILGITQMALITGERYLGPHYKTVSRKDSFCNSHLQGQWLETEHFIEFLFFSPKRELASIRFNQLYFAYVLFFLPKTHKSKEY